MLLNCYYVVNMRYTGLPKFNSDKCVKCMYISQVISPCLQLCFNYYFAPIVEYTTDILTACM